MRARGIRGGMAAAAFLDLTLALGDPAAPHCDLVFDGTGFPFDRSAATPLLISLGSERRADPDDVPPGTQTDADTYGGGAPSARRGWAGDGLDPNGARIGCRHWLLDDAKQTADTRQRAIDFGVEATRWIDARGVPTAIDASWVRQNMLAVLAQAGSFSLKLPLSLA